MYTPCIAIVGRPNVGKSTLFNRCTRTRDALVAEVAGLTRDRQYGIWETSVGRFVTVDTAGITSKEEGVDTIMRQQSELAMAEADILWLVVDGQTAPMPDDYALLEQLRRRPQPLLLVVNKADGHDTDIILAEYYCLGLPLVAVSAAHNRGFLQLAEACVAQLPMDKRPTPPAPPVLDEVDPFFEPESIEQLGSNVQATTHASEQSRSPESSTIAPIDADTERLEDAELEIESASLIQARWQQRLRIDPATDASVIRIAVIGRPNVGKSTLINRLVGEERVAVFDLPGTTRDAISVPFKKHDQDYLLIDTAGVRRRAKVADAHEKFSIIKTIQAIEMTHLVICVIDAHEGLVDQDLHMLTMALNAGRSVVLAVNKWDGLSDDQKQIVKTQLDRRLTFAPYIGIQMISALHGTGVGHLFEWLAQAFRGAQCKTSPAKLTEMIQAAVEAHAPPAVRGRRIKLRYAHWAGIFPPTLVLHGNQLKSLPPTYLRYIENYVREQLGIRGTPIKIELRVGHNPYAGKKNQLNDRQLQRRKRLIKHVKSRGK